MLQTATDASAADKTSEANQENRIATTRQCPFPSGALAVNSPAMPDRMGLGSGVFCRCRGLWLRRSMPVQIRKANLMPRSDKTANRARALTCPAPPH